MKKEIDWKQVYEKWYTLPENEQKSISDYLLNLTKTKKRTF